MWTTDDLSIGHNVPTSLHINNAFTKYVVIYKKELRQQICELPESPITNVCVA